MVIIIGGYGANGYGANGNGVLHWCHYVHHHWSQWIAIGTIFCRHWRQWREPQIVMTLLPNSTVVVTKLIYATVCREITQLIILLGPDGPRADKSRHLTPQRGLIKIEQFAAK